MFFVAVQFQRTQEGVWSTVLCALAHEKFQGGLLGGVPQPIRLERQRIHWLGGHGLIPLPHGPNRPLTYSRPL
jgi:hypothetical protein